MAPDLSKLLKIGDRRSVSRVGNEETVTALVRGVTSDTVDLLTDQALPRRQRFTLIIGNPLVEQATYVECVVAKCKAGGTGGGSFLVTATLAT